jgi:GAF domain-containing protein
MMAPDQAPETRPRVLVMADIASNAISLVERVLRPAGIEAFTDPQPEASHHIIVLDITQLMGDPLAGLRSRRDDGDRAPAIVLAARFPQQRVRDFFRLGVADVILKPYRSSELLEAIEGLYQARVRETSAEALSRQLEGSRQQFLQRSEEIRLLSEIGRTVVNLGDLDLILRRVVEAAAFMTHAEEANIYLRSAEGDQVLLRASKQVGERQATLHSLRTRDTLVGQVLQTGKAILRQPSLEAGPVKVQTDFLVRSIALVPIRQGSHVAGVLGVYNRLSTATFNEHHLTLLMALADWTGVALQHAELVRRLQDQPSRAQGRQNARVDLALRTLEEALQAELGEDAHGPLTQLKALAARVEPLLEKKAQTHRRKRSPARKVVQEIDLNALIREVLDACHPQTMGTPISLQAGPPLPLAPFMGDAQRISRVLEGLVNMAINRTQQGTITVNIHQFRVQEGQSEGLQPPEWRPLSDGDWIAFTISDPSPGLPEGTIQALIAPQVDPEAGREGPGLSMGEIRLIAESLRGVLWYDQTPEAVTLIFALPVS